MEFEQSQATQLRVYLMKVEGLSIWLSVKIILLIFFSLQTKVYEMVDSFAAEFEIRNSKKSRAFS